MAMEDMDDQTEQMEHFTFSQSFGLLVCHPPDPCIFLGHVEMDTEVLGWEMATAVSGCLVRERSARFESLVPHTFQRAPRSGVSLIRKAYGEVLRLTHLALGAHCPQTCPLTTVDFMSLPALPGCLS